MSNRLKTKAQPFDKYESMRYHENDLFQNKDTKWALADQISQFFFGKQQEASGVRMNHHKLGQTSTTVPQYNKDGYIWVGEVYMGGNQPLDVVYDTGSDWLVIEGEACLNCDGNTYNPRQSEGDARKISTRSSIRKYGSATLEGHEYIDRVCINQD